MNKDANTMTPDELRILANQIEQKQRNASYTKELELINKYKNKINR